MSGNVRQPRKAAASDLRNAPLRHLASLSVLPGIPIRATVPKCFGTGANPERGRVHGNRDRA